MEPRMSVRALAADGYRAMLDLEAAVNGAGLPRAVLDLVRLRVSQINGCAFCVDMHARDLRAAGESEQRVWSVAAWREAPYFSDAERAALALAEAATRLHDHPDGVDDDVWAAAAAHYPDAQLAALVMAIAAINAWNRINVSIRQVAGSYPVATG